MTPNAIRGEHREQETDREKYERFHIYPVIYFQGATVGLSNCAQISYQSRLNPNAIQDAVLPVFTYYHHNRCSLTTE